MGYILFDRATTAPASKVYKTRAAAWAQLTRLSKKSDVPEDPSTYAIHRFEVAEVEHYEKNVRKTVTRINLMSGAEYEEKIGTPLHMSPASETYWSM